MNLTSEDVRDMLLSSGAALDLVFGTSLHIGSMPDSPNACVSIYDTSGGDPDGNRAYFRPHIQVRVRGAVGGYRAAGMLARTIQEYLKQRHNETWNSTTYVGIWGMGDILFVGNDEKNRPIFTANFRLQREAA